MDRFPEAFRRFEEEVDVDKIRSFRELRLAFGWWAGQRWRETGNQPRALAIQARKHGIPAFVGSSLGGTSQHMGFGERRNETSWRHEVVTVKGNVQHRCRDLKTGRFIKKP